LWGAAAAAVGGDIAKRVLSSRQEERIANTLDYCRERILHNQVRGKKPRTDGFFDGSVNEWSESLQILEGVLLKVKDEHEEKKNKYIGNISANICFNELVSVEQANYFIKLASQLTYYQFCILALIGKNKDNSFDLRKVKYTNVTGNDFITTLQAIKELDSIGLISQYEGEVFQKQGISHQIHSLDDIFPAFTTLSELRHVFFEITSLEEMAEIELSKIKSMLE
jgi:hypothetical protein